MVIGGVDVMFWWALIALALFADGRVSCLNR